jgi:hypothetical protein
MSLSFFLGGRSGHQGVRNIRENGCVKGRNEGGKCRGATATREREMRGGVLCVWCVKQTRRTATTRAHAREGVASKRLEEGRKCEVVGKKEMLLGLEGERGREKSAGWGGGQGSRGVASREGVRRAALRPGRAVGSVLGGNRKASSNQEEAFWWW